MTTTDSYRIKTKPDACVKGRYSVSISRNDNHWQALPISFESSAAANNAAWALIKSMRASGMTIEDVTER